MADETWTPYRCCERAADSLDTAAELLVEGQPDNAMAMVNIAETWRRLADTMAERMVRP